MSSLARLEDDSARVTPKRIRFRQQIMQSGFDVRQDRGQLQIIISERLWGNRPEPKQNEVYVSNIPTNCYEDELFPHFLSMGLIYEFRLLINFSKLGRGKAFVNYVNKVSAIQAINNLNKMKFNGAEILVQESTNYEYLLLENIPLDITDETIGEMVLKPPFDGKEIHFQRSESIFQLIAVFNSHRAASRIRKDLTHAMQRAWNRECKASWPSTQHIIMDEYPFIITIDKNEVISTRAKNFVQDITIRFLKGNKSKKIDNHGENAIIPDSIMIEFLSKYRVNNDIHPMLQKFPFERANNDILPMVQNFANKRANNDILPMVQNFANKRANNDILPMVQNFANKRANNDILPMVQNFANERMNDENSPEMIAAIKRIALDLYKMLEQ